MDSCNLTGLKAQEWNHFGYKVEGERDMYKSTRATLYAEKVCLNVDHYRYSVLCLKAASTHTEENKLCIESTILDASRCIQMHLYASMLVMEWNCLCLTVDGLMTEKTATAQLLKPQMQRKVHKQMKRQIK